MAFTSGKPFAADEKSGARGRIMMRPGSVMAERLGAWLVFLISLAVISSISNINYIERKRVLATMKSTGYSNGRIFKVFVKENMFVSVIGGLLGIPAGIGLLFSVLDLVQTTTCAYPKPPVLLNVIISFCMILVYSLIANLTVRRKIKKLNTIETLKAVE